MHQLEPVVPIQRLRLHTKTLEVVKDVDLNTFQPRLRGFQIVCLHAESNEFGFDKPVIAACKLRLQHLCVLRAELIERIRFRRDSDGLRIAVLVGSEIHEGKLEMDGAVKVIEEIAP